MKRSTRLITIVFAIIFILIVLFFVGDIKENEKINGLLLLSENTGDITGYYKWEFEMDKRNITGIIKPKKSVLESNQEYFLGLSEKNYEIATGYGDAYFWNMSYEDQYNIMKDYSQSAEEILGKPIKIFTSKYFAYDENTLKAADALGIEYLLARGTEGIRSVIYKPEEYNVKIISVSNLEFGEMGKGSLCDTSLYARGSTAEEFNEILKDSLDKSPDSMILVSHVYIGGTTVDWWRAYENALNSDKIEWKSFEEWVKDVTIIELPIEEIPMNTEVKYLTPNPAVPLSELELLPELKYKNKIIVFHNGQGSMCLEFLDFAESIDYEVEEHFTTDDDFYLKLNSYKNDFQKSQGVSDNFGYYPIIFVENTTYSGFNEEIKEEILRLIS